MPAHAKTLLLILDGFGIGKDSPFNAIKNAKMPFFRGLLKNYPHSELLTHGLAVGLPEGVMGNSEVGHMTLGAGRILYQDLTRISQSIRNGEFFQNSVLQATLRKGAETTGRVHLWGLLSDGGVHSHLDHMTALLDLCVQLQVPQVFVHGFLDGRDTPPDTARGFVEQLERHPAFSPSGQGKTLASIATLSGRYFAMDRDKRWDRVEKAFRVLTGQATAAGISATESIEKSHAAQITDEFFEPQLIDPDGAIRDGDAVVFGNYRADRARELTSAFMEPQFAGFTAARPKLSAFASFTQYDSKFDSWGVRTAFAQQSLENIFPALLEKQDLKQFRIAETEKYAHVTFFFNCGREEPFRGEERLMIASPRDVATYDLKPEMSAFEVARQAKLQIESGRFDFVLMNFANADMVGHTGNYAAAIRAMEVLDECLGQVIGAAQKNGFHTLLTADHGNAEEMHDHQGRTHTQHTLNPVPAIWIAPGTAIAPRSSRKRLRDGSLQDVMPTLCQLMGIAIPPQVTGQSLLPELTGASS